MSRNDIISVENRRQVNDFTGASPIKLGVIVPQLFDFLLRDTEVFIVKH
jgi:hypothetical protein